MTKIIDQMHSTQHTMLPVFKDDIGKIMGVLHVRNAVKFLINGELTKDALLRQTRKPYFVLEGDSLTKLNYSIFKIKERIGIIVDEYGDIQGIVTIEDILEEIVGEFIKSSVKQRRDKKIVRRFLSCRGRSSDKNHKPRARMEPPQMMGRRRLMA